MAHQIVQIQDVLERADEFDIIHFHIDYFHFPFTETFSIPHVTTLHGRLDIPDLQYIYKKFPNQPLVSISDDQRMPLPQANFVKTIHHGLPCDLLKPGTGQGGYLAFLGRISPEKGLPAAIEIAKAAGIPLKIAAKVDKADQAYFENQIRFLLDHSQIDFVGEINESQKNEFLGNALALLFPINWSEPFGLVMIEAMACGTPVIAYNRGAVPEVIEHGKYGFLVNSVEEAVDVIKHLDSLPRERIRKAFEERFTAMRMALDYLDVYKEMISEKNTVTALRIVDNKQLPAITAATKVLKIIS
jgi:glycosyltransferase involved in cell wall biosynthesis